MATNGPPPPPPPPPPNKECDWQEFYAEEFGDALQEGFGNLQNVLENLVANTLGGFLGKPFKFVADDALQALDSLTGDIADALAGGAVSGTLTESGETNDAGQPDGVSGAEIAGIVGGIIGGLAVGWLAGLTLAGILAAGVAATIAGITAEAAFKAGQEASRRRDECLADDDAPEEPDPVPGPQDPLKCPPVSPLIFDMDGDGVETLSIGSANVFFDLDADGRAERTGWVAPDDALLVLDRNTDGTINDITELFGSQTEDGFSELAREDSNADSKIDAQDLVYADLRLWRDANSDGVAQEEELASLEDAGIVEIDLNAAEEDFDVEAGNVSHSSTATLADGGTAEILDVWFENDTSWTDEADAREISAAAARLPILAGSGRIDDLQVAMTGDAALLEAVRDLIVEMPRMSSGEYRGAIETLVSQWAGVESVSPVSRGQWMDGQHLAVLEAFYDFEYRQISGVNAGRADPGPNAAYVIEQQYDDLISRFMTEFAAQSSFASLLLVADLHIAGDPRAADLVPAVQDGSALIMGSLIYDEQTTRVGLSSVEAAIGTIIDNLPQTDQVAYLDRYLGRLAGTRAEHFGTDIAAWEVFLAEQLAPIEDAALREVAFDLARGFELVSGTAGDDDLTSDDTAPANLVRQPQAQQSVLLGGEGTDTVDGRAGGDTYVFRIGDGNDVITDSFFDGIGGIDGGSSVGTYGTSLTIAQPNVYLSTLDTIVFPGRNAADAEFIVDGTDLLISFTDGSGDSLRIVGQFAASDSNRQAGGTTFFPGFYAAVERFVFADGTTDPGALQTTDGNDFLIGSLNDEAIVGGLGDDTLNGGGGDDVYVYAFGDGDDIINQSAIPENGDWQLGAFVGDRVLLTDLNLADVSLTRSGDDVTLSFAGGGSISIEGQGRSERLGIYELPAVEGVEFADGTILRMDLLDVVLNGVPDIADFPNVYTPDNAGGDGVVRSVGPLATNDIFVSGSVAATFDGRPGHDAYVLTSGDAPVVIVDRVDVFDDINRYQNDEDALVLTDMVFADLTFERLPDQDMVVFHQGVQVARIATQYRDNGTFGIQRRDGVEKIIDANGEVFLRAEWERRTVTVGTDGDDFFTGIDYIRNDDTVYYNSDTYDGGQGNDFFSDENGSETYLYALGDGNDTINDAFGTFRYDPGNDEDRLILTDLNAADVRLERVQDFGGVEGEVFDPNGFGAFNKLRVSVLADGGSIDVSGQFIEDLGGIEFLEFADGTVLDKATIAAQAFIYGTGAADFIDIFDGVPGVTVVAGGGDDIVSIAGDDARAIYASTDGSDEFNGFAILEFSDINSDEVRLLRQPDGRLLIDILSTGETILIGSAFGGPGGPGGPIVVARAEFEPSGPRRDPDFPPPGDPATLDEIRFASGEVWDAATILARIELPTTDGDDVVAGSDANEKILGRLGNDDVDGGAGNDTVGGGAGFDSVTGGAGDDLVLMSADGDAILDGGDGRDMLDGSHLGDPLVIDLATGTANGTPVSGFEDAAGGSGDDSISGSAGDNNLKGGIGDDILNGGEGDDTLEGGRGADRLNGGPGSDAASYAGSGSGVTVSLDGTQGAGGHAEGDELTGIEILIGSNYSDTLAGDDADNVLDGLNGQDRLNGLGGNDLLLGGSGDDDMDGGVGNDTLDGGAGRDRMQGGDGDDLMVGGAGRDTMDGGAGGDTYLWAPGNGDDVIIDRGPDTDADVLDLIGVDPEDVQLVRIGEQLNIFINGTETIRVVGQFAGEGIEEIRFADGTLLARDALSRDALAVGNQAPVAIGDFNVDVGAGTTVIRAADLLANDSDFERSTLTVTSVADAVGGSVSLDADGNVVFVADRTTPDGSFSYTISDGELTATATVEVNIPPNAPPVLVAPLADAASPEDAALALAVPAGTFTDADGDALTLTAVLADGSDLPSWLAFDGTAFTGLPPQDFNGALEIEVTASDGIESVTDRFVLTISAENDAPVLALALADQSFDEDSAVSFAVPMQAFTDVDGDALALTAAVAGGGALPSWLAFDGTAFTGLPPKDFNGALEIEVTADDGALSVSDEFTLTITPENDAPVLALALADQSFNEDSAVSFAVPMEAFTDVDGDALALTAALAGGGALPSWLAFDGTSFTGLPPQDFNGALEIEVTASDGFLGVSDLFTLDILPVNDAPDAQDDTGPTMDAGANILISRADVLANDLDVDGDTLSIAAVTSGTGGRATLTASGDISFFADADADGAVTFTYEVTDGALTSTATVTVTVEAGSDPVDPYADYVQGTQGHDLMFNGLVGKNALFGAGGDDVIIGGLRNDRLAGGTGNDVIFGSLGDDLIEGNQGNDRMYGGFGSDMFVFRQGDGFDRIHDFRNDSWFGNDILAFDIEGVATASDALAFAQQRGGKVIFDFGDGDVLRVDGVRLSHIDEGDILIL